MSESDSDFGRSSNIFLDNALDRPLAIANFTHFSTIWAYGAQFNERYCILHFALYTSDTDSYRISGMQETIYKCIEK